MIRQLVVAVLLQFPIAVLATETLAGNLTIHMPMTNESGAYYQLLLQEQAPDGELHSIYLSAQQTVKNHTLVPFSINIKQKQIKSQHEYFLVVKIQQQNSLGQELMSSTFPVLAQYLEQPLNIVIKIPPSPVE